MGNFAREHRGSPRLDPVPSAQPVQVANGTDPRRPPAERNLVNRGLSPSLRHAPSRTRETATLQGMVPSAVTGADEQSPAGMRARPSVWSRFTSPSRSTSTKRKTYAWPHVEASLSYSHASVRKSEPGSLVWPRSVRKSEPASVTHMPAFENLSLAHLSGPEAFENLSLAQLLTCQRSKI